MIENKSSESRVSKKTQNKTMRRFCKILEDKNIHVTHVLYL